MAVRIGHVLIRAPMILVLAWALLIAGCPTGIAGPFDGLPPSTPQRGPFASQCATFVNLCTSSFPVALAEVVVGPHQTVSRQEDPLRFIVQGEVHDGGEMVRLRGRDSTIGNTATMISYSWSNAAIDDDPCTMTPGEEFSTESDPAVALRNGVHYIRLTVRNDLPLNPDALPDSIVEACGTIDEPFKFDFIELVVEVRD